MSIRYNIKIAKWSLQAYQSLTTKVIWGLSFIEALLLCLITVTGSYYHFCEEYNIRHAADCYFYSLFSEQTIDASSLKNILQSAEQVKDNLQASEVKLWGRLENAQTSSTMLTAGNTVLEIDGESYFITDFYAHNQYAWNNITSPQAPIHCLLYMNGYSDFPRRVTDAYQDTILIGNYPSQPGEILFDSYLLKMFGVEEEMQQLLGKRITIYCQNEKGQSIILQDYTLTGIVMDEFLPYRESNSTMDNHLEHTYVNLKEADYNHFTVINGSIRFYYDTYQDYIEQLQYADSRIQVKNNSITTGEIQFTEGGLRFGYIHLFMHYVGMMVLCISGYIIIVVLFSLYYIMENFQNKMKRLRNILCTLGMDQRNGRRINAIQLMLITIYASLLGSVFAGVFFLFFQIFCVSIIGFTIRVSAMAFLSSVFITGGLLLGISRIADAGTEILSL